jgi:hypothetical protein
MTTPWGTGPWGTGAFGASSISIENAVAISIRTVRVTLSGAPGSVSPTAPGDVLNPLTWQVVRLDTGFSFTVAQIDRESSTIFDVHVLEPLGSVLVQHQVSASLFLLPITFPGLVADAVSTPDALASSRRFAQTDIANPQTPKQVDAGGIPTTPLGGTLVITEAGDYDSVSGAELVKKLIIRRVFTPLGGFFHLPDYGIGIAVKEPLPVASLPKLRAEIERQARLEPEVEDVAAPLSFQGNVLTLSLSARIRPTGDRITIVGAVPKAIVSL